MKRSRRTRPLGRRYGALGGLLAVAGAVLALAAPSLAGRIFPPAAIDADNGESSVQLGATIGAREAWVAYAQKTGAATRLFVRYARNARLRRVSQLADNGNDVTGGGLVGDRHGHALVLWGEQVGGKGVVFSRRLSGGRLGRVIRVTPPNTDVEFDNLMNPFDRGRDLVMSRSSVAAFCYRKGGKPFIATLSPRGAGWARTEIKDGCSDLGIDDRGDVVAIASAGTALVANRVVRGQASRELITNDFMDQESLAVGFGGAGLALGRDDDMKLFAYRRADVAQGGRWQKVGGVISDGILVDDGRSAEDPFAAMDGRGNGAIVFRDNAKNGSFGYYRLLGGGVPGRGGKLFSQSIGRSGRIRIGVDRLGRPVTAHSRAAKLDANGETVAFNAYAVVFRRGAPGRERALLPGVPDSGAPNILGLALDNAGDFTAPPTVFSDNEPFRRVRSVLADYSRPRLRPRARVRGRRGRLNSHATDPFRTLRNGDVRWRVPGGVRIVRAARRRGRRARGKIIRVRFRHAGRFRIRVTAGDGAGNRATKVLRIRVRRRR